MNAPMFNALRTAAPTQAALLSMSPLFWPLVRATMVEEWIEIQRTLLASPPPLYVSADELIEGWDFPATPPDPKCIVWAGSRCIPIFQPNGEGS